MAATTILPPIEALEASAAELAQQALDASDTSSANGFNKAIFYLKGGVAGRIVSTVGGFLIPSSNTSEVYRVSHVHGCSCKGFLHHNHCYHVRMLAIAEHAGQHYTMPSLATPDPWEQARAKVEVEELFA